MSLKNILKNMLKRISKYSNTVFASVDLVILSCIYVF